VIKLALLRLRLESLNNRPCQPNTVAN